MARAFWIVPVDVWYSTDSFTIDGSFEPGARAPELIRSLKLAATCLDGGTAVPCCTTQW